MAILWEITGWLGAGAILGAFLAVSMGWLKAGRSFQLANLLGACAFIVNSAFHGAWPSVITNIAWFIISAVALIRLRSGRPLPPVVTQVQPPGIPPATGPLALVDVLRGPIASEADVAKAPPDGNRMSPSPFGQPWSATEGSSYIEDPE